VTRLVRAAALTLGFAACKQAQTASVYEKVAVERRNIVVSASAAGAIQPILTVDVKSKASGEIIGMPVETGDEVRPGQLLARIDPRIPQANLEQAQAALQVADAQLQNAQAQLARSDTLFKAQAITQAEYETAKLGFAQANAQRVNARTNLQSAKDAMEDTQVRAPLKGTIISKSVELGTVISSPTRDVGGGTVLLRMANLDTVQVAALVDETDIGKVQPGLPVTITVDAYPNRPFSGSVLKIEPQAQVNQNVTQFSVLVNILNPEHAIKPGMNTEVEIHVGEREGVLAIPNAALRTMTDLASAAQVLGLDPQAVQRQLAQAAAPPGDSGSATMGGGVARPDSTPTQDGKPVPTPAMLTLPDGRQVPLPAGVSAAQVQAAMRKRMSGGELTSAEQAMMRRVFSQMRGAGGAGGAGRAARQGAAGGGIRSRDFGGRYVVFVLRDGKPFPLSISTGLTDLDFSEVTNGLTEQDTVLVLPSASLVNAQKQFQQRVQSFTGGGIPGLRQQTPAAPSTGTQRNPVPR
jgi:HlyD family secretion protein